MRIIYKTFQRRTMTTLNSSPHSLNRIQVPQNVLVKTTLENYELFLWFQLAHT